MTPAFLALTRLGFLLLLWIFIFGIVWVVRADLFGRDPSGGHRRRVRGKTARTLANPPSFASPLADAANAASAAGVTSGNASLPSSAAPSVPSAPMHPQERPHLTVTAGPLAGTRVTLGASPTLIGRSPDCTLVLNDPFVSSRHARIFYARDSFWLEDLNSTNGTFYRGSRVYNPVIIAPSGEIKIGKSTMELNL